VNCKFCDIAAGRLKAEVVFEDALTLAFLDIRPLFSGHLLLIPRVHHETMADLPRSLIEPLFLNAQLLARAVERSLGAEGSFVAINNRVSQSVPHLHIHIVPRRRKDGLKGFFWPRQSYRDENELVSIRTKLVEAIRELAIGT
jgi:histidine triad (HIT) family protein